MKIKENFVLRQVAGTWSVLPLAEETVNLDGMLVLNDAGAVLWKVLEQGCELNDLAKALTDAYVVDYDQALADAKEFVEKLKSINCIID